MIENRIMGESQTPVHIGVKTYYRCHNGCKECLRKDSSLRKAEDPLNGHLVDKSEAYIIKGYNGEALYFESEKTAIMYINR